MCLFAFKQDTCTGFLLGGIGELDKQRRPNFFVVDKGSLRLNIALKFRFYGARYFVCKVDDVQISSSKRSKVKVKRKAKCT